MERPNHEAKRDQELARLREHCTELEQELARLEKARESSTGSERFFHDIFDCIQDGISILDTQQRILQVNRTMEVWYAHAVPLVGKLCFEAYHGRTEPCPVCPTRTVLRTGQAARERVLRRGAGGVVTGWLDLYSFPLRDASGTLVGVIEYVRDVTEQYKAEEALLASEKKYRQVVELSEEGIMITDAEFRIVFANPRLGRMLGYARQELVGLSVLDLIPASEHEDQRRRMKARRAGLTERFERLYRRKDGSLITVMVSATPILEQGRFVGAFAVLSDITHLKATELALRASETRYRLLFSEMAEAFALHEMLRDGEGRAVDYRFVAVNPAFERMTGLKAQDVVGRTVREILPDIEPEWIETYDRVVRSGNPETFERYTRTLGRHFHVHAYRTSEKEFACLFVDVTDRVRAEEERRRLEEQLQYAQKLESLGILAGGIAHDFNNILMAILGNTELAREEILPGSRAEAYLEEVEKAARRAADLCREMLAYAGRTSLSVTWVSLNDIVTEMTHMLEVSVSKKVVLRCNLGDAVPPILADVSQMRQILMNLVINASEAIGEKSGVIIITTGLMDCDAEYLSTTLTKDLLKPGRYVYLEVSDTGCGIPPETLPRIFDPFFTTKFTGRGLGLAAVLGIVRGHKGAIKVYSEPGHGTTFKVLFPVANPEGLTAAPLRAREPSKAGEFSGLVLLVDDEEGVRMTVRVMLERLGFQVLTAEHGREAVSILRARAAEVRCILLDMTMPHWDGVETYAELRRIRADIPVILCSGYTEDDAMQRFVGKGLAGFLQKPYTLAALTRKLREVLHRTGDIAPSSPSSGQDDALTCEPPPSLGPA